MDATVVLKIDCVIEQLKSLKDHSNAMISPLEVNDDNQIWIDDVEQLDYAIKLIESIKLNHEDISKCVELLSLDGKGSKITVKEILEASLNRIIEVLK